RPGGRTRWDLTSLTGGTPYEQTLRSTADAVSLLRDAGDLGGRLARRVRLTAADQDDSARRWLFPDHFPAQLRMGTRQELTLTETLNGRNRRLWIQSVIVGVGWLDLPSGPREVVLQRTTIQEEPVDGGRPSSRLLHRWIDARAGVVAWHDDSATAILVQTLAGATPLRLHVDEIEAPAFGRVTYGFDLARSSDDPAITANVSDLAAGLAPGATVGDLIGMDFWDFSVVSSGDVTMTHISDQVTAPETCNFDECGYTLAGVDLEREDRDILGDPNNPGLITDTIISHQVTETELRFADPNNPTVATDTTTWLRAATQNEGRDSSGLFATNGENRICYTSEAGTTRTPVPLWRYPSQDAGGWYMQAGDPRFSSGIFQCEQNINNENCGGGGSFATLRVAGTTTGQNCPYEGVQYGEVVKEGVVKMPSGHTFNALLVRNVAAFCIYRDVADCSGFLVKLDEARTVTYLWMVPRLGTTIRLQSPQISDQGCSGGDPDLCFTEVLATDIKFGLYPPLSIAVDALSTSDTSVTISWDPGLQTDRIDGFKVYWNSSSGGSTSYAFDSQSHPGQVAFAGNSATISGLTAGTDYFLTVTSLSTLVNPSSGVAIDYESLLFPTQLSGDPSFVYPVEVMATTTGGAVCDPPETTGLTLTALGSDSAEICWDASPEACVTEYQVGRSDSGDFSAGCTPAVTAATCLTDSEPLSPGSIQNFLARPFTPTAGSWGQDSDLVERTNTCSP
ncbi:MAG: fibronectin type III domain-containing protein, partial [Acidobacteria bacterium]|nr:fibronectin type III domain-containing protein [Acidobacteriota bacterium]